MSKTSSRDMNRKSKTKDATKYIYEIRVMTGTHWNSREQI
jgi:hypothetical protein